MIEVTDLGLRRYAEVLDMQRTLFAEKIAAKREGRDTPDRLLLVEHNPVVTLGRHAKRQNMLLTADMLAARGIDCAEIERGGDVTYHGPGQLVAYPIIDLQRYHLGVKDYVNMLEESVIQTLAKYNIQAGRLDDAPGVWLSNPDRKICALGVKCSRFVTMHGLALNVSTDLTGFSVINPCGFTDKGVTSIEREIGEAPSMSEVKRLFSEIFISILQNNCY